MEDKIKKMESLLEKLTDLYYDSVKILEKNKDVRDLSLIHI